ncbi:MAG: MarR family winged helix-turn-helix transcriptional regulator [Actinocrinis sp.]
MSGSGPAQAPAETQAAAGPRWLSDDEQRTWLALLAAINQLDADLDRQLQRDSGLSHPYYMVLAALSESPGRRMRMSDLATINHASQSRLTHAVNRLVAQGWVRREKCEGDRRVVYAVLTDEGFEVLKAAAPGHVEAVRGFLFDQLTPQQVGQLREISERLTAGRSSTSWPSPRDPLSQG